MLRYLPERAPPTLSPMYWDEHVGGARFVVSHRSGGTSAAPYDGLNLALHVGDDPVRVLANRATLAADLGVAPDHVVYVEQVHGDTVLQVDGPLTGPTPQADGLVTRTPGLALAMMVADCVPVLLVDRDAGVAGVAHAGRAGMHAGVAVRVVEAMRDLGATNLIARLGPSVCPRHYGVPLDLREQLAAVHPVTRSVDRRGNPAIDVAAGVLAQLAPLCWDVEQLPGCTAEDPGLYSHRRDGTTGRFVGAVLLQERR